MKRITYPKEIVNHLPLTFFGTVAKNAMVHSLNPVKAPYGYIQVTGELYLPVFDSMFVKKNPCMFGIPQEFAITMDKKGRGKGRNREDKYKDVYEHESDYTIPDELIQQACDITRDSAPVLAKGRPDRSVFTWRADYKGSAYYMYKQGQKIIQIVKEMAEQFKFSYFLTTTFDTKLFDGSRRKAFRYFIKEQQKMIKAAKRKYGTEAVKVVEVTNRGYPHAHILFFSDKPLGRFGQKKKKTQIIKQGDFYNFLKSKCTLGRIQLKTVENNGVHKYIAKYIAKANFDAEAKGKTKKGKMSQSARKAKMSAIFPSVFGYRAFSYTWSKKKESLKGFIQKVKEQVVDFASKAKSCLTSSKNNGNNSTKKAPEGSIRTRIPELVGDSLEVRLDAASKAKRSLASLISFSIKENKGCAGMLRRLVVAPNKTLNKKIFGTNSLEDFLNLVDETAHQTCVSCCGCPFITKILEFAEHPEEEWAEMIPSPFVILEDEEKTISENYEKGTESMPRYISWAEAERRLRGIKILDRDLDQKMNILKEKFEEAQKSTTSETIWEDMQSLKMEQIYRNFIRDAWVSVGYTEEDFKAYYVG